MGPTLVFTAMAQPCGYGDAIWFFAGALFPCALVALSAAAFAHAAVGDVAAYDGFGSPTALVNPHRRNAPHARMVWRGRHLQPPGADTVACFAVGWIEAINPHECGVAPRLHR